MADPAGLAAGLAAPPAPEVAAVEAVEAAEEADALLPKGLAAALGAAGDAGRAAVGLDSDFSAGAAAGRGAMAGRAAPDGEP